MTVFVVVAEFFRADEGGNVFGNVGVFSSQEDANREAVRLPTDGFAVAAWVEPWELRGAEA